MRRRLYEVLDQVKDDDKLSGVYGIFMLTVIIISLIPLAFKTENRLFLLMDKFAVAVFIIDYLLRLYTADLRLGKGAASFLLYPFTPLALFDLLCILPSLYILSDSFRLFKTFRLIRTMRVFRVFKAVRYSPTMKTVHNVFRSQSKALGAVFILAGCYIMISALVVFNVEPDTFGNFFDAVYWATVSMTTVGYGDIYTVSTAGRVVAMISAVFGIAVIALPSGIITAGFMDELNRRREEVEAAEKKKALQREGAELGDH